MDEHPSVLLNACHDAEIGKMKERLENDGCLLDFQEAASNNVAKVMCLRIGVGGDYAGGIPRVSAVQRAG
jgi:hypothetical protein